MTMTKPLTNFYSIHKMARYRIAGGIIGPREFPFHTHRSEYVFFSPSDRTNGTMNEWVQSVNMDEWDGYNCTEKGCLYHKKSGISNPMLSIISEATSAQLLAESNRANTSDENVDAAISVAIRRIGQATGEGCVPGMGHKRNDADMLVYGKSSKSISRTNEMGTKTVFDVCVSNEYEGIMNSNIVPRTPSPTKKLKVNCRQVTYISFPT